MYMSGLMPMLSSFGYNHSAVCLMSGSLEVPVLFILLVIILIISIVCVCVCGILAISNLPSYNVEKVLTCVDNYFIALGVWWEFCIYSYNDMAVQKAADITC